MTTEITDLRLQLLANGYSPIMNLDKRTFLSDWPNVEITPAIINKWGRSRRFTGTGLRVENGLAVIDIDVNGGDALADRIANALHAAVPKLKDALVRLGKGSKEAWFVRTSEPFSRIHSSAWTLPGETVDDGTHRVEVFGGGSARQFGAFGPHTVDEDGNVVVSYDWLEHSPADTRLESLPELTKDEFFAAVDAATAAMQTAGLQLVPLSKKGENDASRVYDLADGMSFDLHDGRSVSLSELREIAASEDGLRCSAAFVEGAQAVNRTRCLVGHTKDGRLTVWDSAHCATHMEAEFKPAEPTSPATQAFAEALKRIKVGKETGAPSSVAPEPPVAERRAIPGEIDRSHERRVEKDARRRYKVNAEDDAVACAAKLIETYAYCPNQQNAIVPLWTDDLADGIPMTAFRTMWLPNKSEEVGPRGGRVVINPVDIWASDARRVTVAGVRLRPDQPRPTYKEGGKTWINCYREAELPDEGGDAAVGLEFMEHLIPDAAERQWFLRWLAYKLRRPDVPGPAVVMVARQFGTGRGTLGEIVKKLFGRQYVATVPFAIFAGRNTQSQYTDWQASSLIVLVNESSETEAGASKFAAKQSTYEHLKEIVDPRPLERTFIAKGRPAFKAISPASYIIATNNIDALPIPDDDRRFAVLANGDTNTPEFWERVNAWIEDDANIGALGRYLRSLDLGDYSPFAPPPRTIAKRDMVDAGKTDLDRAYEDAIANLQTKVFVPEQIVALMRQIQRQDGLEFPERWQGLARRMVQRRNYRVGVRHGNNWQVSVDKGRHPVYATSPTAAGIWTAKASDELRREVLKNGSTAGESNVLLGAFKKGE